MATATSQQLARYYADYQNTEITFTNEVVQTLSLDPRQIFIKCVDSQWPCIINSSSLAIARIIIGTKSGAFNLLQHEKGVVNLRFSFLKHRESPISFFVSAKVADIAPYKESEELVIISLNFTQRPPDDLIEILGQYSDADVNAKRKKDERIPVTQDVIRKLGLTNDEITIILQGVSSRCMLRDLAFAGARVLLLGVHGQLTSKNVLIQLEFDDMEKPVNLPGTIKDISQVNGDNNMAIAVLLYQESMIPMAYKIRINNYLSHARLSAKSQDQDSSWFSATDMLSTTETANPASG
jgi:hypothetical protein